MNVQYRPLIDEGFSALDKILAIYLLHLIPYCYLLWVIL